MTKSKTLRVQMVAAVTAMLLVSFMVVRTSSAAFTDSVTSGESSLAAGTLLFDSTTDVTGAISVTGLLPLDSEAICYEVTYGGSAVPGDIDLSWTAGGTDGTTGDLANLAGVSADNGLHDYLTMDVVMGAAGETCSTLADADGLLDSLSAGTDYVSAFSGSLADSSADLDSLASGTVTGWSPNPDAALVKDLTRAFVIELTLPDVGNSAQGDSATVDFTWNVASTTD